MYSGRTKTGTRTLSELVWETIIPRNSRRSSFMCSARFLWETGNPQHRQSTEEISVNKVVFHSLTALTRSQSTSLNGPACALLPLLSYAIFCFSFLWCCSWAANQSDYSHHLVPLEGSISEYRQPEKLQHCHNLGFLPHCYVYGCTYQQHSRFGYSCKTEEKT